jgi:predicted transcriptional regulator
MSESLVEMAKELVRELIQSGQLSPGDMQNVLQSTYQSLVELKASEETGSSIVAIPGTVDWKKSITRHLVTCLECCQTFKQLSARHLRQHNLDGRSYRAKYGIPRTQPLAARSTTTRRRELAQEIKPWEKAREMRATMAKKAARKKMARAEG